MILNPQRKEWYESPNRLWSLPCIRGFRGRDEYPLDRPLRKALFAVDELCGFIHAVALVRPTRLEGMAPKSVKKKLKTAAFAAAVKREDITRGAELLDLSLDEHIAHCITALQGIAEELGLQPE